MGWMTDLQTTVGDFYCSGDRCWANGGEPDSCRQQGPERTKKRAGCKSRNKAPFRNHREREPMEGHCEKSHRQGWMTSERWGMGEITVEALSILPFPSSIQPSPIVGRPTVMAMMVTMMIGTIELRAYDRWQRYMISDSARRCFSIIAA